MRRNPYSHRPKAAFGAAQSNQHPPLRLFCPNVLYGHRTWKIGSYRYRDHSPSKICHILNISIVSYTIVAFRHLTCCFIFSNVTFSGYYWSNLIILLDLTRRQHESPLKLSSPRHLFSRRFILWLCTARVSACPDFWRPCRRGNIP